MIYFWMLLLAVLFIILIHTLLIHLYFLIKGFCVLLICSDIIQSNYDSTTYNIIINFFNNKKYKVFNKFMLKNKSDKVFSLIKIGLEKSYVHLYEHTHIAMRNMIITLPTILPSLEKMIIENGKKDNNLVFDFAVATKDINFSKKKLFVAISHNPKIRNLFILRFKNDKEIEKLTSLL